MAETEVKLLIEYSGKSDVGLVRSENQDSFGKFPIDVTDIYSGKGQLFIIADGMGGHAGGKIASRMAVDTVSKVYFNSENLKTSESIKNAFEQANKRIYWESQSSDYNLAGMGTTCSVMVLKEKKAVIGHVGDSRIYKIEENKIQQLTEDHTQVNEMLKEGILTSKEAENYPLKTVLARALGTDKQVKTDITSEILLREGQSYVLCTDGLGKVKPHEILKIVSANSAAEACEQLIQTANERGGNDNVTVLVIKITSNRRTVNQAGISLMSKKNKSKVLIFLAILIVLIIVTVLSINSFPFLNRGRPINKIEKNSIKPEIRSSHGQKKQAPPEKSAAESPQVNYLLNEAAQLFKTGKSDDAAEIYKKILEAQPMHLAALQGLSKIALSYFHKAEDLRFRNKIKEALQYYLKMEELQPGNTKVIDLIKLCEYQIKIRNPESK